MTEQELEQIPFRMISHLAMENEHCIVYESTNPLYNIRMCKHTRRRKNGDFGKSYVHYAFNGKVYKTKQELLDAINNMNYGKDKEQSDTAKDDV